MTFIPSSAIVWKGLSPFSHDPIVGIVTGLDGSSNNPKTGKMAQLWIIRSDMHPSEALATRADRAICGDCPLRPDEDGKRVCYVNPMGPAAVWRSYRDGKYIERTAASVNAQLREQSLPIRLGAYGEPVALPHSTLRRLVKGVKWTGYTHQWRAAWAQPYRDFCMASVDSPSEMAEAHALGWRTFRVRSAEQALINEVICPASEEAGHRTTCAKCKLCQGASLSAKSIVIIVHGHGSSHFKGA